MKETSQSGAAHVVTIACLVLALLTALGWIFYQNFVVKESVRTETDAIAENKVSKEKIKETAVPKDVSADWLLYTSKNGYTVRLPDGWRVLNENDGWLVSRGYNGETPNPTGAGKTTSVVLKEGVKAVVHDTGGPGECYRCRFVLQQDDVFAAELKNYGLTKRASTKTKQGNSVDRYQKTVEDNAAGFDVMGTKRYYYHIHAKSGTKDIVVSYEFQPGETNIVKTVDLLVETVQFKD